MYKPLLFDYLIEYTHTRPVQFHIPGHKKGLGTLPEFYTYLGSNLFKLDLINIEPLDDLHNPLGIIQQAQNQAAKIFNAQQALFSVQGTSTPIMAMILSVINPGDKILIPRNMHKSILTALIYSGANPIYIEPLVDENLGIAHGISSSQIANILIDNPDIKAILIINPTYYGYTCDLEEIVKIAHTHNIPVLVDEAHGTHLNFSELLPKSGIECGADLVATSVHKLGGALVGGSILLVNSALVNEHQVAQQMSMLTTTSTSYPILASIDCAITNLANSGDLLLAKAIKLINHTRTQIKTIDGIICSGDELLNNDSIYSFDPLKLLITFNNFDSTGYHVEKLLRINYNIEVELSTAKSILLIVSISDTSQTLDYFVTSLKTICKTLPKSTTSISYHAYEIFAPSIISPREAFYSPQKQIKLTDAIDKISCEPIFIYPPGIPIILPGSKITRDVVNTIQHNKLIGLPVKGTRDPQTNYIYVINEGDTHD